MARNKVRACEHKWVARISGKRSIFRHFEEAIFDIAQRQGKIADEQMWKIQPERCVTALCPHALNYYVYLMIIRFFMAEPDKARNIKLCHGLPPNHIVVGGLDIPMPEKTVDSLCRRVYNKVVNDYWRFRRCRA